MQRATIMILAGSIAALLAIPTAFAYGANRA
jgi:hypothetical protein